MVIFLDCKECCSRSYRHLQWLVSRVFFVLWWGGRLRGWEFNVAAFACFITSYIKLHFEA